MFFIIFCCLIFHHLFGRFDVNPSELKQVKIPASKVNMFFACKKCLKISYNRYLYSIAKGNDFILFSIITYFMKYEILTNLILLNLNNNKTVFKGYDKLKLLNFKNFKIFIYIINRFLIKLYLNLINVIINFMVKILMFIMKLFNSKFLINFVKINKMYTFVKRIFNKLIFFNKKKEYKKKLIKYFKRKRNIDININMITMKLQRKRKLNLNLKKNKDKIFKYLYNYLYYESTILSFGKFFDNIIIPFFNKIHYIVLKVIRILRLFDKNIYSNSLHLKLTKFLKNLEGLNIFITKKTSVIRVIKKLDELFYTLFVNKMFKKSKKRKKRHKVLYNKKGIKVYVFKFVFVIFILFKLLIILKHLYNSNNISFILEKYDIFFSSKNFLNYYLTRYISTI